MCPEHRQARTVDSFDRYRSGMGWAGIKNGQLLKLVADDFVFITSDKNLRYQQNLSTFDTAIILLPSNQVPIVRELLGRIEAELANIGRNDFVEL